MKPRRLDALDLLLVPLLLDEEEQETGGLFGGLAGVLHFFFVVLVGFFLRHVEVFAGQLKRMEKHHF